MNKRINKFKIILIAFDIIVILLLCMNFITSLKNNKVENEFIGTGKDFVNIVSFKKFKYMIPKELEYKLLNENQFSISSDKYSAIIEINYDPNNYLFENPELYYLAMAKSDTNIIDKYEILNINDNQIITIKKNGDYNVTLCFLKTIEPFIYRITFSNTDNTYKIDGIENIITILLNGSYDDASTEKYYYDAIKNPNDIKEEFNISNSN